MFWNSIKSTRVIKEWTFTGLKCRTLKPSFTFTFYFLLWQAKLPVHMSKKSCHFPKLLCSHVSIRPQNKCKIFQIYINYCDFKWNVSAVHSRSQFFLTATCFQRHCRISLFLGSCGPDSLEKHPSEHSLLLGPLWSRHHVQMNLEFRGTQRHLRLLSHFSTESLPNWVPF